MKTVRASLIRGRIARPRRRRAARTMCAALLALLAGAARAAAQDPFADAVVEYQVGEFGGFGSEFLPDVVLGPPVGGGAMQQSLDVVSLGNGGVITLRFDLPVICDGPGPDLVVFENTFLAQTPMGPLPFEEFGIVSVSQDGETFIDFPWTADPPSGFAGRTPVFSTPENGIDPLDPEAAGGDVFDLADVGLGWAAYVRITDPGLAVVDPGNNFRGDQAGFDLDAIAALHACDPGGGATPTASPTPTATPPVSAGTPTATTTPGDAGDLDGDGDVDEADRRLLVAELFDGDGDAVAAAGGGVIASGAEADVNGDGRITAADVAALGAQAR